MEKKKVLPRTEYTGETKYAEVLANNSNKKFTAKWLLDAANPSNQSEPEKSNV
ncbi:hypothetical protein D3C73_1650140 [compost metagenome]